MEMMYGVKVLEKLLEQWKLEQENEAACQKYITENTVLPKKKWTNRRRYVRHVMFPYKKPPGAIKWSAPTATATSATYAESPPHAKRRLMVGFLTTRIHTRIIRWITRLRVSLVRGSYFWGGKTGRNLSSPRTFDGCIFGLQGWRRMKESLWTGRGSWIWIGW
jgi:hypothetical protein